MTKGIWIMLILYVTSEYVASELMGSNVCQQEERYKVNITKYDLRNITVRSYKWCLQVPPRCSTYIIQQMNDTKTEEEYRIRYVKKCCDGFYELDGEEICVPNKCRSCEHGQCDIDGNCHCESGYWGINCDEDCSGKNCRYECSNCTEGHCAIRTGNCTACPPKLIRCDLVCSEGHNSSECMKQCNCDTMTGCDPFTKKCSTTSEDYPSEYDNNDNFVNNKLVNNKRKQYDDLDVTNMNEFYFPFIAQTSAQNAKNPNQKYLTTESYDIYTTQGNETEHHFGTKEQTEPTMKENTSDIVDISTETNIIKEFKSPKLANNEIESNIKENRSISVYLYKNKTNNVNTVSSSNESPHRIVVDSHLFVTIITGALFTVLIIISAAVFCVLYKLKEKRKKYVNSVSNGQENRKIKETMPSLSVTTRSIFHTPLPDPPIFENPAFSTQFESPQVKQPRTFETHVICNVNVPKASSINEPKQDLTELFYDHPPSTGSYRAVSIPEPPNSNCIKLSNDPIYDEIPCNQRIVPISTPLPSYTEEQSILYVNTK